LIRPTGGLPGLRSQPQFGAQVRDSGRLLAVCAQQARQLPGHGTLFFRARHQVSQLGTNLLDPFTEHRTKIDVADKLNQQVLGVGEPVTIKIGDDLAPDFLL
jgi:hypothetical protein